MTNVIFCYLLSAAMTISILILLMEGTFYGYLEDQHI